MKGTERLFWAGAWVRKKDIGEKEEEWRRRMMFENNCWSISNAEFEDSSTLSFRHRASGLSLRRSSFAVYRWPDIAALLILVYHAVSSNGRNGTPHTVVPRGEAQYGT